MHTLMRKYIPTTTFLDTITIWEVDGTPNSGDVVGHEAGVEEEKFPQDTHEQRLVLKRYSSSIAMPEILRESIEDSLVIHATSLAS